MTILGFDFGMKSIGIAVGQTFTKTAQALSALSAKQGEPTWNQVEELIKSWKPEALIVGIPLNMNGTEQPITHAAKKFAKQLEERFRLPVHLVDERLSTVEAREKLFDQGGFKALKKANIDSTSAQLILEMWLQKI